MALMQLTVTPLGTQSTSVGEYVAEFQEALKQQKIPHTLTDMGTIIEGSADELLQIAARIHELPFNKGAKRVVTQIVMDDRRDKHVSLGDKIASVQARMK
jgi:uncharacterized protein (TIGR00106 family)